MYTSARIPSSWSMRRAASSVKRAVKAITAGHGEAVMSVPGTFRDRCDLGDRGLPAFVGAPGTRFVRLRSKSRARPAEVDGPDPRHPRELAETPRPGSSLSWHVTQLSDITRLTETINVLAEAHRRTCPSDRPRLASHRRMWELTAAKLVGTDRSGDPVQKRGGFRSSRRGGTGAGVVGQHCRAGADDAVGQPSAQRGATPHRRHSDPSRRSWPGLLPAPPRRGRLHPRSAPLPQTPPCPRRLRTPAHRLQKPHRALPTGSGLT